MRIVALLSFYDETDEMLRESIGSLQGFADALVAVDGAYKLYPGGKPSSGERSHDVIRDVCQEIGIELNLYVPETVWVGGEVEKREKMFRYGERLASNKAGDWFFILDGDFVITDHLGAREALKDVRESVACVTLDNTTGISLHPLLFRPYRGIEVGPAHHHWKLRDGRWLWHPLHGMPKADLSQKIIVEHRQKDRPQGRADAALAYYATRDRAGIEEPGPRSLSRKERLNKRRERRLRAQKRSI
jgi:hypothetical protein